MFLLHIKALNAKIKKIAEANLKLKNKRFPVGCKDSPSVLLMVCLMCAVKVQLGGDR